MSASRAGRAGLLRFGTSLALLSMYLLLAAVYFLNHNAYEAMLRMIDAMPNPVPFGDLDAILQAGSCWRKGVNVYVASACMHGGEYNYSPFLLRAAYFPIGPQDRFSGGLIVGAAFIASLSLLPPARSYAELLVRILAACSGTVIYALESANFDIVIFVICVLGVILILRNHWVSLTGYALFLLAAALKFYPLSLLALALRERLRTLIGIVLMVCAAGAIFMLYFGGGTSAAISIIPGGLPFRCVFGAVNMLFGLVLICFLPTITLEPNVPQYFAALAHPYATAIIETGTHILCVGAFLAAMFTAPRYRLALKRLDFPHWLFFMAGAIVIVFCFFAAQNLDYRGIFLILTIPGLWSMAKMATDESRRRHSLLCGAVVFLLWEGFFRSFIAQAISVHLASRFAVFPGIAFWLLRELVWWWVIIQLTACMFVFVLIEIVRLWGEGRGLSGNKVDERINIT